MGFDIEVVKNVMKNSQYDMEKTVASLLQMQADGTYNNTLEQVRSLLSNDIAVASTSNAINQVAEEEKVR